MAGTNCKSTLATGSKRKFYIDEQEVTWAEFCHLSTSPYSILFEDECASSSTAAATTTTTLVIAMLPIVEAGRYSEFGI